MDFYLTLASILTTTPSAAERLVRTFNTGDQDFFQHYYDTLPTATLSRNTTKNNTVNTTLYINTTNLGKGAFGVLEKNQFQPYVYKLISNEPKNKMKHLKSLFREIIIQALLDCDPEYGHYVCTIYKVYKMDGFCIFKLEQLDMTLKQRIQLTNNISTPELHTTEMRSVLLEIFKILNYFRTKYGFYHNDLHLENIMTSKSGPIIDNLKLIDFGFSSVNFDGIYIPKGSESSLNGMADCYNLSYYFKMYVKNTTPEFVGLLTKLVDLPEETPIDNYVDVLKQSGGKRNTRKTDKRKYKKNLK